MKTKIVNGMLFLMLQLSLSSCFDFAPDFDFGSGWGGMGGYYGGTIDFPYTPTFGIDSITKKNDEITIWAYIKYDTTMTIKSQKLTYQNMNTYMETSKIISSTDEIIEFQKLQEETVDWSGRQEWVYRHQVTFKGLEPNVPYYICIYYEVIDRDPLRNLGLCMNFQPN